MVIPLNQCVARPDADGHKHLLVDHLTHVARAAGDPSGAINDRLAFLAGLLHDAAKCHEDWQTYIDPTSTKKKGPPHSPMGAALFCFAANKLIPIWCERRGEKRAARDRMLNWTLAISGHHGRLGDFSATRVPWLGIGSKHSVRSLIAGCDLAGVFDLVRQYLPQFTADAIEFSNWLEDCDNEWLELVEFDRKSAVEIGSHHELAMRFPHDFSRLIIADRIHAGSLADDCLEMKEASAALETLASFCTEQGAKAIAEGADEQLVRLRSSVQDRAAAAYAESPLASFYTLLLPTGYGKTLTSLRIALEACVSGRCKRIIYVAPYISILSQAVQEIGEASGLEVFEHHHLSLAKMVSQDTGNSASDTFSSEFLKDSDDDFEVLDTWKAPVVATTFNQFFRAIFPVRAQHTLRIDALESAFVIVDEPQIIDVGVWNLFLRALNVFASQHQCQVVFSTATLPPLELGLETPAVPVAPSVPSLHRYDIEYRGHDHSLSDVKSLVSKTLDRLPNLAVVLNTVRDAYEVFDGVRQQMDSNARLYCLTAMMLPSHKSRTIREIRHHLEEQRHGKLPRPLVVVCTQILEAGVNLSFRVILRARSILPSTAQVAGRANRHNEGDPATVYVFPFKVDGERELRRFVYRDETACRITDRTFERTPIIPETAIVESLAKYFDDCWQENSQTSLLKLFETAALGEWSCLAELEPFGFSPPREEVFVPVPVSMLEREGRELTGRFAPQGAEQLLDRYLDKEFQRKLSFREKKLFNIAMRQFVVPTRNDIAERIASEVNDWLWLIDDVKDYSWETGLAHWLGREDAHDESTVII